MSNRFGLPEDAIAAARSIMSGTIKEEVEQIDELSKATLKSYVKKSTKAADKAWDKSEKEEDKAMATDGMKYPEKQKRHMDAAIKHTDVWRKRDSGIKVAKKKLGEEFEEDIFVLDEQYGVGAVLNYTDDTVTVVFEGHVEEYDADDVALVEEVVDLQEISKETLQSYTAKAKADPAFEKKKGKPSKTTVAIRAKRTAGLENAKARLQAIVKKENEAHMEHAKKLSNKLDAHFEAEAPKILAKHGYEKIHSGTFKDPYGEGKDAHISTYVKKHDSGHVTMFAMHKKGDTGHYGSSVHEAKATSTKGSSFSGHTPHYGVFDDKGYEKHMTDMMPKFEQHVIHVKEHGDNNRSW